MCLTLLKVSSPFVHAQNVKFDLKLEMMNIFYKNLGNLKTRQILSDDLLLINYSFQEKCIDFHIKKDGGYNIKIFYDDKMIMDQLEVEENRFKFNISFQRHPFDRETFKVEFDFQSTITSEPRKVMYEFTVSANSFSFTNLRNNL